MPCIQLFFFETSADARLYRGRMYPSHLRLDATDRCPTHDSNGTRRRLAVPNRKTTTFPSCAQTLKSHGKQLTAPRTRPRRKDSNIQANTITQTCAEAGWKQRAAEDFVQATQLPSHLRHNGLQLHTNNSVTVICFKIIAVLNEFVVALPDGTNNFQTP